MAFTQEYLDEINQKHEHFWNTLGCDFPVSELLQDSPPARYKIIPEKEALHNLVEDAQIIIAIGAVFGDEAKGKVGNAVAKRADAVARANSTQNTGRTTYDKQGNKLVFHAVTSAILEGLESILGPEVYYDPITLMEKEVQQLVDAGIPYREKLFLGNSYITMPFHRIMDVLGSTRNSSTQVGSRPMAKSIMGRTACRLDDLFNSSNNLSAKIEKDMQENYVGWMMQKELTLSTITTQLGERREKDVRVVPPHVLDFAKAYSQGGKNEALDYLVELFERRVVQNEDFPQRIDATFRVNQLLSEGKTLLIEPTQSFFLSGATEKFYGYGTSADTSAGGVLAALSIPPGRYETKIIPVFKFPGASKVGIGDIPGAFTGQSFFSDAGISSREDMGGVCQDFDEISKMYFSSIGENGLLKPSLYEDTATGMMFDIGSALAIASAEKFGEEGATTKKPRVTGLFDCVLAAYIALTQGTDSIISCMDRVDLCEDVGLVVGYVLHFPEGVETRHDLEGKYINCSGTKYRTGHVFKPGDELPTVKVLQYCRPIIKVIPSGKETPIGAESGFDDALLPEGPSWVLSEIEYRTGLKIVGLGNGKETENMIYVEKQLHQEL